ncbi:MAG: glycosyltransferase family 4 protein [Leptodesmis sp.]|uniref:glycosyltransferase family 4 protein n=1 Tax=Leptodesmis sp. TaxID=3100501 RepID=UPI003D0A1E98
MRILYDGEIFAHQAAGGINRYFANIISRLPADFVPTFATCQRRTINCPVHPNLRTFYFQRYGFRPGRVSYWLEKYYFRAVSRFTNQQIAHPTYYRLLSRQDMTTVQLPIALTVYDMIYEIFKPEDMWVDVKRKAVQAADVILCISENTKKDLLERIPIAEDRVRVTYLASELDISLAYGTESVPTAPYFLYVGARVGYKNFDTLLAAFAKAVSVRPDFRLVVVGAPLTKQELAQITDLNLQPQIDCVGYPTDSHLAKLYRCSLALVYPSRYEGFGIPPLEAMSCGTVPIAANTSSIPEVVGEAGILLNPDAVGDLADSLLFLADHSSERDRLIQKGFERCKQFSWDKTAAQTIAAYQSII